MMPTKANVRYHVLHNFDSAAISPLQWNTLVEQCNGSVFMTWHYQKVWWEVFGRGKLLIVVSYENEQPIAIAPLFTDEGMIYFVGSGGSDYLHFIGDIGDEHVLLQMLYTTIGKVPEFVGFLFYHIPTSFRMWEKFDVVSRKLGLLLIIEGEQVAPSMSIKSSPQIARVAVQKKSLLRHEAWFKKNGNLEVQHCSSSKEILPWLERFFEQHQHRWAVTPYPSLFNNTIQCLFYKRLAEAADESGWLRFNVVLHNEVPVAFHFGFLYNNSFLWYKPSFDIRMAKHSPGELLLRQLLIYAIDNSVKTFDFGLGDEAFKQRFATHIHTVQNFGLYPTKSTMTDSV